MTSSDNNQTERKGWKLVGVGLVLFSLIAATGCLGLSGTNNSTSTPSVSTETSTETLTQTTTPTLTPTATPERTTGEKYAYFRDGYVESLENSSINVSDNSINSENNTLYVEYTMRDPKNDTLTGWERENVSMLYVVGVETYLNQSLTPTVNESWVPERVNVTALAPDGERYETAYTTLERAKEMIDGEMSARRYLIEYYGTIEPGPANPEYEE